MHDGDTWAAEDEILKGDPWDIIGVPRSADLAAVRKAYRIRARTLHPDVSEDDNADAAFRELVTAFKKIERMQPGSRETHPLWPHLSELDQYWSREQGHDSAEDLEDYLKDLGSYEYYLQEYRIAQSAAGLAEAMEPTVPCLDDDESMDGANDEALGEDSSALGIEELLDYRIYLGNEQWRVRWTAAACADDEQQTSWERFAVLDTEELRRKAIRLKEDNSG